VVTAEVELGKLEVSKKLINAAAAQEGEIFNFSIVVDFSSASVYADTTPWMNDGYLLSLVTASKELTWTENEDGTYTATFTLKADEAITIEGLAVGTGYTLREELTAEDRKVYEVTTQIATDGTVAEANKGYEANGSIAAQNAVRFTNEFVPSDGPDTGDAGIGMPLLLGVVSILGAAVLVLKRRRFVG
jgi:LPXTG-motif cell wall-anchored protein